MNNSMLEKGMVLQGHRTRPRASKLWFMVC
jgi:hypothetical protein